MAADTVVRTALDGVLVWLLIWLAAWLVLSLLLIAGLVIAVARLMRKGPSRPR